MVCITTTAGYSWQFYVTTRYTLHNIFHAQGVVDRLSLMLSSGTIILWFIYIHCVWARLLGPRDFLWCCLLFQITSLSHPVQIWRTYYDVVFITVTGDGIVPVGARTCVVTEITNAWNVHVRWWWFTYTRQLKEFFTISESHQFWNVRIYHGIYVIGLDNDLGLETLLLCDRELVVKLSSTFTIA